MADDRMFLDFLKFFIGQASVFIDDVFRNTDFPDVMKKTHEVDFLLFLLTLSHSACNFL